MKKSLLLAALCVASMASTATANPWGWVFGPVRQQVGPAIRQANPYAYSGLLALNRSFPPQVKNNWNNQVFDPYRGGVTPWNAELNYWRSMPPEVRNNIVRQQQGYQTHHQAGDAQPVPHVIYVPGPAPPAPIQDRAGAANAAVIPAPPPPNELPRIIRPD